MRMPAQGALCTYVGCAALGHAVNKAVIDCLAHTMLSDAEHVHTCLYPLHCNI